MIHQPVKFIETAATIGAISGILYNLLCVWSAARFLRDRRAAGEDARPTRPVSILKPLKGTDPEMYENLRSHFLQDYPEYEIIFGVSNRDDPAIAIVKHLRSEFPLRRVRLVICERKLGANVKVSNLAQMLTEARHDYLVVSDSDIRVGPNYLNRVTAPLQEAKNGLVTCLYRGVSASSVGSRLESIGISTDFAAGVLAARTLENGIRFGLGSTLAFRRGDLISIGGFEAFADYLADDYEIGKRIAEMGLEVELSEEIVETYLPPYSLMGFLRHQIRWARTIRASRFGGHVGLIFTFAIPWTLVALLSARGAWWSWELLATACCARLLAVIVVGVGVLNDRHVLRRMWLIPLRDVVAVFVWLASFAGRTVVWRGDRFRLKNGKLAVLKS